MTKSGTTYLYHTNLRGDIVTVTDESGNIKNQYAYDPWGNQLSCSSETVAQPFKYASYLFDSETGLYYLKHRYYSPSLGRFMTTDSYSYINYEDGQTLNLYSYCRNNPVSSTDPSGNVMVNLRDIAQGANISYDNNTKTATVTMNGITQSYTGNIVNGRMQVDNFQFYADFMPKGIAEDATDMVYGAYGGIENKAIQATIHGAQRLAERGFTEAEYYATKATETIKTQADGAKVYIKQIGGKYNVIVEGSRGVVTALKNISNKAVERLGNRYGWK